ncbi:cation:proton antiporter, partial [Bacteroidota bacterium]
DLITLLIVMAAAFTLINVRYLKLPSTIGLMILALCLSLFVVLGEVVFSTLNSLAHTIMSEYKFSDVLFKVMLSFLLFAGALEVDLKKLGEEKWPILILATAGTLLSTFIVGTAMYFLLPLIGLNIAYIYCLLFGALISPTDPISVLAMVKKTKVSKNLEMQISGESLFNDGVGVVVFLTILHVAQAGVEHFQFGSALLLFVQEVFGGIILGLVFGFIGFKLLDIIENKYTEIEVLVTLSMVLGGATVAEMLHISGPLAMVTMGIIVGREGRSEELANVTGEYVYKFWHLIDEAMNAILFILIGLQIIVIAWELDFFIAAAIAIGVVLTARFLGVGIPITGIRIFKKVPKFTVRVLTWSGLRGGISVALALSLYDLAEGQVDNYVLDLIIAMTYSVVLFSIIVQGLTVKKVFKIYDQKNPLPKKSEEE